MAGTSSRKSGSAGTPTPSSTETDLVKEAEATRASAGYHLIGKRTPLIDAALKVTGRAEYTDDIKRPGMLVGRLLKSVHPHARIRSIDVEEARRHPGVAAVLTGDRYPTPFGVLPMTHDETALAVGRVRFLGEHVAAVAAVDEETCERAFELIHVEYEPLPVYDDPKVSREPVPVKIHDRALRDTNLQKEVFQHFGDVPKALEGASQKVKLSGKYLGVSHGFTEPHCTIAEHTPDGRLTVWSATQVPHYLHRSLSEVLGMPMHRIRVVKPEVGGGFGGKSDPFPHEIACAALAIETGRPVKVLFDREDVFYLNHGRHPTQNDVTVGVDADGKFLAMDIDALIDGGAWSSFGVVTTYYNGVLAMGPYRFDNFRYQEVFDEARRFAALATLGFVFLVYAATEALGGSGILAAIVFGGVLGNEPIVRRLLRRTRPFKISKDLRRIEQEMGFVLRAFFLFLIGMLVVPLLPSLTEGLILIAVPIVLYALRRAIFLGVSHPKKAPRGWVNPASSLLGRGLTSAVLLILAFQTLPRTSVLLFPALMVIIGTNVVMTVGLVMGMPSVPRETDAERSWALARADLLSLEEEGDSTNGGDTPSASSPASAGERLPSGGAPPAKESPAPISGDQDPKPERSSQKDRPKRQR